MQTDYAPECLHTDVPSKEALLAAAQDGSILQATAARCDVQHNLILPLDGMTGISQIPLHPRSVSVAGSPSFI